MDDHGTLSVAFFGSLLSFTEKQLFLVSNSGPSWPLCLLNQSLQFFIYSSTQNIFFQVYDQLVSSVHFWLLLEPV
jgi:hypothetical protein